MSSLVAADLIKKRVPKGEEKILEQKNVLQYLEGMEGWSSRGDKIEKIFQFNNYYETTAFVNAVAWIAHREDHHPDTEFDYKTCRIALKTHRLGGVTENDLRMAVQIDRLVEGGRDDNG